VTRDQVRLADTLGGRLKVTGDAGPVRGYAQGSWRGLVNDGGADPVVTVTGWSLKEAGRGNHWAVSGGAAVQLGDFQIAPNVVWQRPLVGPMPSLPERYDPVTNTFLPAMAPRSILAGPFAVLDNREMLGAELMFTWDPTPGTWFWAWDNELVEDAPIAASLDLSVRHHPTSRDASVGFTADGAVFAFPGAPPAADLFEATARVVANLGDGTRLLSRLWAGHAQARGDDPRLVLRGGADVRLAWGRALLQTVVKLGDYGPYDYHRDFNLTFPFQLMADAAWAAGAPGWLGRIFTRLGVRGTFRTLDAHSNRLDPTATRGHEWELLTYLQTTLGGTP
jgi:beta-galactosidase